MDSALFFLEAEAAAEALQAKQALEARRVKRKAVARRPAAPQKAKARIVPSVVPPPAPAVPADPAAALAS